MVHPEGHINDQEMRQDRYVDGNMLGGPLGEFFAFDITSAIIKCMSCGAARPVANLHVYGDAPGMVGRCPECGEVVLCIVRSPRSVRIDLRGAASLEIMLPA